MTDAPTIVAASQPERAAATVHRRQSVGRGILPSSHRFCRTLSPPCEPRLPLPARTSRRCSRGARPDRADLPAVMKGIRSYGGQASLSPVHAVGCHLKVVFRPLPSVNVHVCRHAPAQASRYAASPQTYAVTGVLPIPLFCDILVPKR